MADEREQQLLARELEVTRRELAMALRESVVVEVARSQVEDAKQFADLREANAHLVVATVRADEAADEELARSRTREEFLAMLAHELRNPLSPIVHSLELIAIAPSIRSSASTA